MRRRWQTTVVWSLWGLELVVLLILLLLGDGGDDGVWGTIAGSLFILVFATTGALVASRVPANPVGWLLCLAALSFCIGAVCLEVSVRANLTDETGPGVVAAAWVGTFIWLVGLGPAATFVLLLFPDGHFLTRRWRLAGWLSAAALAATLAGVALRPGVIDGSDVVNPFGLGGAAEPVVKGLEQAGLALLLVCILIACASLVARYRAAGHDQRQQLKWLAWSLPAVLGSLTASFVAEATLEGDTAVDVSNAFISVGLMAVPIAITVAILRHRLYDIDLVIKRTLVYSTLTVALLGTYLVSVLLLQTLLRPVAGESDLAVAASTLAVAALFRPLRAGIQGVVDRRFFRSRYDAARTLENFSTNLRHELDLDSLGADLRAVVGATMQPEHVSLWLRRERAS